MNAVVPGPVRMTNTEWIYDDRVWAAVVSQRVALGGAADADDVACAILLAAGGDPQGEGDLLSCGRSKAAGAARRDLHQGHRLRLPAARSTTLRVPSRSAIRRIG
jgi:hypothetical protein